MCACNLYIEEYFALSPYEGIAQLGAVKLTEARASHVSHMVVVGWVWGLLTKLSYPIIKNRQDLEMEDHPKD